MKTRRITSAANPFFRTLLKETGSSGRDGARRFLAEGPHAVEMALAAGSTIVSVVLDDRFPATAEGGRLLARLQGSLGERVSFIEMPPELFGRLAGTRSPQGIAAFVEARLHSLDALPLAASPLLAVCDGIQDPGNLGTIIRAADAVGADAVVVLPGTCDPFSAKTVRSTAGSIFSLPIVESEARQLAAFLASRGIALLVTEARASGQLYDADLTPGIAFAFGNEARGVSSELSSVAGRRIAVPIAGKAESLNVAMAASVCLYEALRQRLQKGSRRD